MREGFIKKIIINLFFQDESIRRILFGPSKGIRYRVNSISGRAAVYGNNERHVQKTAIKFIKENMTIYDIGAHCGLHTLLFSRLVGNSGVIYSFEPVAENIDEIKFNLGLNCVNNVRIIKKAVSDFVGTRMFDLSQDSHTGHIVESEDGGIRIECTSLDNFIFLENNPPPDFIKIDVEGNEVNVLSGALRLLSQKRPVVVCEVHSYDNQSAVIQIMEKCGYAIEWLDHVSENEQLCKGKARHILARPRSN